MTDYFRKMEKAASELKKISEKMGKSYPSNVGLLSFYVPAYVGKPENLCGVILPSERLMEFRNFVLYDVALNPEKPEKFVGVDCYARDQEKILRYALSRKENDVKILRERKGFTTTNEKVLDTIKVFGPLTNMIAEITNTVDKFAKGLTVLKELPDALDGLNKLGKLGNDIQSK